MAVAPAAGVFWMTDQRDDPIVNSIGSRLRAAREARGMTLDDVATRTRVPLRHLHHIESGDWDALPAPTYSVGFVRSYANSVGLNGTEMGAELRDHLGGGVPRATAAPFYEPADPSRVPPRSLAIGAALIALLLIAGYLIWRGSTSDDADLEQAAAVDTPIVAPAAPPPAAAQPAAAPVNAEGPVVVTAVNNVWLRISEADGTRIFEKMMQSGERYEVPATAQQPQLRSSRPENIRISVGATEIPAFTERTIANVSLRPADLVARLRPGGATPAAPLVGAAAPVQQPGTR